MNFTIARKNGGAIVWSEDQIAYIIDAYVNKKIFLTDIAKTFGCSTQAIRGLLRRKQIPLMGQKLKFPRNELYFYSIDSSEKAYWLGFLYADGCVHNTDYSISITLTDKEHLEKFKNAIGAYNHTIGKTTDTRFTNAKDVYYFAIRDKQLHSDLIKWGCIPHKSTLELTVPNIPYAYLSHFIRGYFDGDGSLHLLKNRSQYRMSLLGSKPFLEEIRKILNVEQISLVKGKGCYILQIAGRRQLTKILSFIYHDSTNNTRLDRKYHLYQNFLQSAPHH